MGRQIVEDFDRWRIGRAVGGGDGGGVRRAALSFCVPFCY
jgi:hypothetical protein